MNFIQQAYKGKNEWHHWLITFVLIFIGWQVVGVIPLFAAAAAYSEDLPAFIKAAEDSFMSLGINSNLFLFLMILSFFVGLVFLLIGVKYVHKRSITSLATSRKKVDWKRVSFGFFTWGIIAAVFIYIGILWSPENYIWNFKPVPFFTLLAISVLFLPFQTSFEELLFRGYFMQGFGVFAATKKAPFYFLFFLAAILIMLVLKNGFGCDFGSMSIVFVAIFILHFFVIDSKMFSNFFQSNTNIALMHFFNSKFIPLFLTSVIFGLLHGANPEVEKLGQIAMVFYIGTGFFFGIATLMDEGTELALGLHAANNIIAAFFVTTDWTVFQTDALYIDTAEPSVGFEMFFPVFVLYPLLLFFFSKKYGWVHWKEKLFGKIVLPENISENNTLV